MRYRILSTFLIGCAILISCKPQKEISSDYTFRTECLSLDLDGSQTLKAWGTGTNRSEAIEQAKKNAVRDVIFKGIYDGKQDCQIKPVITEVNAQLKHEEYFIKFFSKKGDYKDFIKVIDDKSNQKSDRNADENRQRVSYGIVLRILRSELQQKLKEDGILNK